MDAFLNCTNGRRFEDPRKGFIQKTGLQIHLRYHTDDRPYKCDKCDMRFHQIPALRRHEQTHMDEKPKLGYIEYKACYSKGSNRTIWNNVRKKETWEKLKERYNDIGYENNGNFTLMISGPAVPSDGSVDGETAEDTKNDDDPQTVKNGENPETTTDPAAQAPDVLSVLESIQLPGSPIGDFEIDLAPIPGGL